MLLVMSYATDRLAPWDDSYVHMTTDITYLRSLRSDVQLHMIAGTAPDFDAQASEKAARRPPNGVPSVSASTPEPR